MSYSVSTELFEKTFAVKGEGTEKKLTHFSAKQFKLFPFIANNNVEPVMELKSIVGRFLCRIEEKQPEAVTVEGLIESLQQETEVEPEIKPLFQEVVRHMFFDEEGQLRPINLEMFAHISCEETHQSRLADYLVDVLGDQELMKDILGYAKRQASRHSNILESFAISKLRTLTLKKDKAIPYYRITTSLKEKFEEDFEFILGARNRTRDYLIPLLELYYFAYTAQACLTLDQFLGGSREEIIPLYFCLEWEKTSQNRPCFTQGWRRLQPAVDKIFAHAIVLEILNQTDPAKPRVDYMDLEELLARGFVSDEEMAGEIRRLTDLYRSAINDCPEMAELQRTSSVGGKTAAEVKFLFDSVQLQFESVRDRPYDSYAGQFRTYCRKFLKSRGRSGLVLNLTEETLIFLTRLCIKDHEKIRLNDVFREFESRGIFLDNVSKEQVMHYYEKLNLIEKKSDSGDAQYVKRIL